MTGFVPQRLDVGTVTSDRVEPFLEALRGDGMGFDPAEGQWFAVGGYGLGTLFGVARVRERSGAHLLDDVFVAPEWRRRGYGAALVLGTKTWAARRTTDLWLLSDEDLVPYYERLGFTAMPPASFPAPLAALCEAQGEWPAAGDHLHVAMRAVPADVQY